MATVHLSTTTVVGFNTSFTISQFETLLVLLWSIKASERASREAQKHSCLARTRNAITTFNLSTLVLVVSLAKLCAGRMTQKCDVYSFGVVLLELLSGQEPVNTNPSRPAGSTMLVDEFAHLLDQWKLEELKVRTDAHCN